MCERQHNVAKVACYEPRGHWWSSILELTKNVVDEGGGVCHHHRPGCYRQKKHQHCVDDPGHRRVLNVWACTDARNERSGKVGGGGGYISDIEWNRY